ncbi:MAG: CCA tRNA nucleotidyltransferase, partial [Thermoguttaceae bacterium]
GGFVRDFFMGIESKDIDIEVYGLDYDSITLVLKPSFRIDQVGKSFGVIKVCHEIDLSIPRRESKSGTGHTGFVVETDSNLTPLEAFGRRDFTINAIGMRIDGSLCDPYNGKADIENRLLRATTDAFGEDPLRVLRGMQFAARFGFDTEPRTIEMCKSLLSEFDTLSKERIWTEWQKWATKGTYPSKGLQFLRDTGWITKFPEIANLIGCVQDPKNHPEGDVFVHTQAVCDEAVTLVDQTRDKQKKNEKPDYQENLEQISEKERLVLMFACLAHDFGKPATTIVKEDGSIGAPGHAAAAVPVARTFLDRINAPNWVYEQVLPLVGEHMAHKLSEKKEYPSDSQVRRLAARLEPATIKLWGKMCLADFYGCGGYSGKGKRIKRWLEVAEKLGVLEQSPAPILRGRDLMQLGIKPGPQLGEILKAAYEAQLDGEFETIEDAIKWSENKQTQ